jgi:hypothetical protein
MILPRTGHFFLGQNDTDERFADRFLAFATQISLTFFLTAALMASCAVAAVTACSLWATCSGCLTAAVPPETGGRKSSAVGTRLHATAGARQHATAVRISGKRNKRAEWRWPRMPDGPHYRRLAPCRSPDICQCFLERRLQPDCSSRLQT